MLNVCRDGRQHTPENLKYFFQNFIVFALLILDFFAWSAAATFHDSENNFSNSTREMPCFMASELSLSAHETDIGSEKQKLRVKLQFFSLPSVFFLLRLETFVTHFMLQRFFTQLFFPSSQLHAMKVDNDDPRDGWLMVITLRVSLALSIKVEAINFCKNDGSQLPSCCVWCKVMKHQRGRFIVGIMWYFRYNAITMRIFVCALKNQIIYQQKAYLTINKKFGKF